MYGVQKILNFRFNQKKENNWKNNVRIILNVNREQKIYKMIDLHLSKQRNK